MLSQYLKALSGIGKVDSVLDIGCGTGGVLLMVGDYFKAKEMVGVDKDIRMASGRGINCLEVDMETGRIPLPSNHFDLVMTNGMLNHLKYMDNTIQEAYRLLKPGGHLALNLPNMSSYIQWVPLIFGFQPSDVHISQYIHCGTIFNNGSPCSDSVHGATARAMRDLLSHHGFKDIKVSTGNPAIIGKYSKYNWLVKTIGWIRPKVWARRIIIVAEK